METSLLTEHLRFTPLTLLDDIINTVNELVSRAVDAAEAGLLDTDPANLGFDKRAHEEGILPDTDADGKPIYPEAKSEIEEGLHKLETLLESNVDRNFDKFEIYILRGVLNVPEDLVPWVKLGHYEGIRLPSKDEATPSAEEVQKMQHRLRQTRRLNAALEFQLRRNNAALEQLRSLLDAEPSNMKMEQTSPGKDQAPDRRGAYSFLTSSESAKALGMDASSKSTAGEGPLATNTSFALSQLPALRNLLDELRPKLADIGDAEAAASESHSARERRIYLHKQSRKAVERQGVDVNGSADGLGRRIQPDELAALESIAESLSANKNNGDAMEE